MSRRCNQAHARSWHAGDPSPFVALPQQGGAVYLVRLKGEDPQCLVDPGSNRTRPECWAMAEAEAEGYISVMADASGSGGGGKRLLLQGRPIRSAYRTLTCGSEMAALLESTGYESADSWCSVAKQALRTRGWQWQSAEPATNDASCLSCVHLMS